MIRASIEPQGSRLRFLEDGRDSARGARLHEALREGVSYVVYKQLVSVAGLEHQELARYLVIPPATLRRRAKAGKFKVEESDRLYRFAEVLKAAIDLFEGDRERAVHWLSNPVRGWEIGAPWTCWPRPPKWRRFWT